MNLEWMVQREDFTEERVDPGYYPGILGRPPQPIDSPEAHDRRVKLLLLSHMEKRFGDIVAADAAVQVCKDIDPEGADAHIRAAQQRSRALKHEVLKDLSHLIEIPSTAPLIVQRKIVAGMLLDLPYASLRRLTLS